LGQASQKTSGRFLGKYQYAEWADMRAHFAFNYTRDVDILIHLPRSEAAAALFADMYCLQLPGRLNFLVVHLTCPIDILPDMMICNQKLIFVRPDEPVQD
jgi:hypothetical protein